MQDSAQLKENKFVLGIIDTSFATQPVTTPISLPGMPPITVSASLPFNTIEAIQNEQQSNITVTATH